MRISKRTISRVFWVLAIFLLAVLLPLEIKKQAERWRQQIVVLDMVGLVEEFKAEIRTIPEDEMLSQTAAFGKALDDAVESRIAKGLVIMPQGAALGVRDITGEVRASLCGELQRLCPSHNDSGQSPAEPLR